jgi:uncharacterized membrane protein YfcA
MMNRQIRRAQEKSDKKAAKEKEKAKAERQAKRYLRQQRRAERPKNTRASQNTPRRSFMLPLWLTVVFTFFSAFTIIIQALVPSEDGALNLFIRVAYYFLFPYFLYAWLARLKVRQVLYISIGAGLFLTFLSGALQFFLTEAVPDIRILLMGVPAAILGGYLGQVVMNRSG